MYSIIEMHITSSIQFSKPSQTIDFYHEVFSNRGVPQKPSISALCLEGVHNRNHNQPDCPPGAPEFDSKTRNTHTSNLAKQTPQ